jgi:putative FmdB family regulatory protein
VPIYEYQCTQCGAVTDIKHGFKETTSEACPKCGGALKRLFNPAGIVFKGPGFYVTDSRKGESAEASGASKSSEGGSAEKPKPDAPKSGGTGEAAA